MLNHEVIDVDNRVSHVEKPVRIEDMKEQVLRNKTISLVKVISKHQDAEGATLESKKVMRRQHPHLLE